MSRDLPDTRVVEARAKINPFLRVLGRRDDGFHDLETVVLPISLADRLEIHAASSPQFRTLALSLDVDGDAALLAGVPVDETNLVLRAAAALAAAAAVRGFADIVLEKRVPVAAGLGGGSSDAAATLRVLNDLWGCSLSDQELSTIAAEVGSDVPALLVDGPVLVGGRGEDVRPIGAKELRWALLPLPFGVSTADAYGWWDEDRTTGEAGATAVLEGLAEGDAAAVAAALSNDLEPAVLRRHPQIGEARASLLEAGALAVMMSGSGPTLAALLDPEAAFEHPGAIEVTSAGS